MANQLKMAVVYIDVERQAGPSGVLPDAGINRRRSAGIFTFGGRGQNQPASVHRVGRFKPAKRPPG